MDQALVYPPTIQERLGLADLRLYLVVTLMVLGNVVLPFAFHQVPNGGKVFLPIFFFTLIAGWRFGWQAGILTALLSPLTSHVLTGMPALSVLFKVIAHSALLGGIAAMGARLGRKTTPSLLTAVVLTHQVLILVPVMWAAGLGIGLEALGVRWPGLALQVFGGVVVLRLLERFLPISKGVGHDY